MFTLIYIVYYKDCSIPLDSNIVFIPDVHGRFSFSAFVYNSLRRLFDFLFLIRSQFFTDALMALYVIGTIPSSRKIPTVLVCFCTPSSNLQNILWSLSIGLFFGSLRHPQKSLAYSRIGLIIWLYRWIEFCIFCWKRGPNVLLIFINAFKDLIRKSPRPLFISPDGVTRNPRYLYFRTFSWLQYCWTKIYLQSIYLQSSVMMQNKWSGGL